MNSNSGLQNERKRVTVLFADISGSTQLVEKMDPEDVVSDLLPTVEVMARVVQQFGGTVVKTMGDGLMAIFGAPVALERHAERACYAALEVQRLVEEQQRAGNGSGPGAIRVHLGLATGEVVVGFLGEDCNATYDAAGFTVHLASRLQAKAPAGKIYISPATFKWVQDRFECENLGPTRIRGSEAPIKVYALKGPKHEHGVHAGPDKTRGQTPFVGRDAELAELLAATTGLMAGHGGIVSIVGDPGVGKSRLVSQFKSFVTQMPVTWLEGASLPYGRTLAYWPFLELIRSFAGIAEHDDEREAWQKVEDRVAGLFGGEVPDVLPYIATFLGLRVRGELEERVRYLDGEGIRRQVFRTMRLLFERLAQQRPTIILFEDAFWMDRSSAALLTHLIPLIETMPLLICLVTRGESDGSESPIRAHAASMHPERYREVVLKPLSSDETDVLVGHLMQMSNLPPRMRKAVCAASDGNPLFAEELARSLLDSDAILRQQGSGMPLASMSENGQHELPGSIESVIMSRVDQLEETAKETLKTASVIGRTFIVRVLSSVVGSDEVVRNGLVVLKRADLVLDRRLEPDPECMFKHVLVQEATYNSILLKRRRDLHARVGETIERLFGDRLEDLFGLLAHHYARAEQWEKAQHYLLKAGDQADRLAADEEALAHFQAASETYMRAFGRQAEPIWQAVIARKIGEAYYRKGDHEEAREKFRAALKLLGSRDPQSPLGLSLQILYQIALQVWHRMLPAGSFDRRLGSGRSVDDELVRIFIMQWWLNFFESPHRTLLYSLKTLNESERRGVVNGIVHSCSSLGFVCSAIGAHTLAQKYHHRAVRQAGESDNPIIFGHAELGLGWHGCYNGQWSEAVEHFRRSADLCRRAGDLRQWGSATWGMVLVLCHLGRFADAWAHAHELFEISEASGDQVNLRWSRVAEGMVLLRLGLPSEATAKLEVARRDGRAASDWQIYTKATCELARCCLQRGDLKMADDVVCDAVATVRRHGLRGHHVSDLQNVRTMLLLAKLASACEGPRIPALRRQTRRAARQAIRGGKIFRGSLPEARRLRGQYAWLVGDAAEAEMWWQDSRKLCEELGASYDLALTEIELGACLGDPLHQERGKALLAESRHGIPAHLTVQAH